MVFGRRGVTVWILIGGVSQSRFLIGEVPHISVGFDRRGASVWVLVGRGSTE